MKLRRSLGPSVRALLAHPLRASLAAGSVAIGVASVVVTTGAGSGARAAVERNLGSTASDLVVVRPVEAKRLATRRTVRGAVTTLKPEDVEAIAGLGSVAAVSAVAEARGIVKAENATTRAGVRGTGPRYAALRRFPVAKGRFFDDEEERTSSRVAVLGARVAESLFSGEDPVGQTIRFRGVPLEVIGVLGSRGASPDGADEDALVVVPARTALRRLLNVTFLSSVVVKPRGAPEAAESEVRALLRRRHRLEGRDVPDDFEIQAREKAGSTQRTVARSLSLLSTGLGAVALAVGTAGILALMLLSVRERTAEIGLRMALGATPADILLQFLGEAALLAVSGGIAGALVGAAGTFGVSAATGWPVAAPVSTCAAAMATSLAAGLLAGALPAWLASRVPPVEALASR